MQFQGISENSWKDYKSLINIDDTNNFKEYIDELSGMLVVENGIAVGIILVNLKPSVPTIAYISVLPEYRLQGYGTALLHSMEFALASSGFEAISTSFVQKSSLTADENLKLNSLKYFFDSNGYILSEGTKVSTDNSTEDTIILDYAKVF